MCVQRVVTHTVQRRYGTGTIAPKNFRETLESMTVLFRPYENSIIGLNCTLQEGVIKIAVASLILSTRVCHNKLQQDLDLYLATICKNIYLTKVTELNGKNVLNLPVDLLEEI